MNIISLLDAAQETNTESYFQDTCESCSTTFVHGDPIHTLRNGDSDHPMSIVCDKCFNVTTNLIGRK